MAIDQNEHDEIVIDVVRLLPTLVVMAVAMLVVGGLVAYYL